MTRDARDELVEAMACVLAGFEGREVYPRHRQMATAALDALVSPEVLPGMTGRAYVKLPPCEPDISAAEVGVMLRAALCAPEGRREE